MLRCSSMAMRLRRTAPVPGMREVEGVLDLLSFVGKSPLPALPDMDSPRPPVGRGRSPRGRYFKRVREGRLRLGIIRQGPAVWSLRKQVLTLQYLRAGGCYGGAAA